MLYWRIIEDASMISFQANDADGKTLKYIANLNEKTGEFKMTGHSMSMSLGGSWKELDGSIHDQFSLSRVYLSALMRCVELTLHVREFNVADELHEIYKGTSVFRCVKDHLIDFEQGVAYYGRVSDDSYNVGVFENLYGQERVCNVCCFEPVIK